jgi:hypothetical protein
VRGNLIGCAKIPFVVLQNVQDFKTAKAPEVLRFAGISFNFYLYLKAA